MLPDNKSIKSFKLIVLGLLVLAGIVLHQAGILGERFFLEAGEHHLDRWWFPPLIILVSSLLYVFALPGSVMYVVAGLLYQPIHAMLIIIAGGVTGAIGAYFFSRSMSQATRQRVQSSKAFSIMKKHGDFATLSAIRILPGFPHSVTNYGSGILEIPLPRFIVTAAIGFAVKGYLYSSAIHQATHRADPESSGSFEMVIPLVLLAVLFLLGKILRRKTQ